MWDSSGSVSFFSSGATRDTATPAVGCAQLVLPHPDFEHPFKHLVGAAHYVRSACKTIGQRRAQGISQCERLFSSAWS